MAIEDDLLEAPPEFAERMNAMDITVTMSGELWGAIILPLCSLVQVRPECRPAVEELVTQIFATSLPIYDEIKAKEAWPETVEVPHKS